MRTQAVEITGPDGRKWRMPYSGTPPSRAQQAAFVQQQMGVAPGELGPPSPGARPAPLLDMNPLLDMTPPPVPQIGGPSGASSLLATPPPPSPTGPGQPAAPIAYTPGPPITRPLASVAPLAPKSGIARTLEDKANAQTRRAAALAMLSPSALSPDTDEIAAANAEDVGNATPAPLGFPSANSRVSGITGGVQDLTTAAIAGIPGAIGGTIGAGLGTPGGPAGMLASGAAGAETANQLAEELYKRFLSPADYAAFLADRARVYNKNPAGSFALDLALAHGIGVSGPGRAMMGGAAGLSEDLAGEAEKAFPRTLTVDPANPDALLAPKWWEYSGVNGSPPASVRVKGPWTMDENGTIVRAGPRSVRDLPGERFRTPGGQTIIRPGGEAASTAEEPTTAPGQVRRVFQGGAPGTDTDLGPVRPAFDETTGRTGYGFPEVYQLNPKTGRVEMIPGAANINAVPAEGLAGPNAGPNQNLPAKPQNGVDASREFLSGIRRAGQLRGVTGEEFAEAYQEKYGKEPGPYHDTGAENIGAANIHDLAQYRDPETGDIYATPLHGDTATTGQVTTGGRASMVASGGAKGALSDDRAGNYGWASSGEAADTLINKAIKQSKGLSVVVASAPETVLTGHGREFYGTEAERRAAQSGGVSVVKAILNPVLAKVGAAPITTRADLSGLFDSLTFEQMRQVAVALKSRVRSGELGILPQDEIIRRLVDPDYAHAKSGDAIAFLHLAPGRSVKASDLGITPHPLYPLVNPGGFRGDLPQGVRLSDLAPGDYNNWLDEQTARYKKFTDLPAAKQREIKDRLDAQSTPQKSAALAKALGVRVNAPKPQDWVTGLKFSKQPVKLDPKALERILGTNESGPNTEIRPETGASARPSGIGRAKGSVSAEQRGGVPSRVPRLPEGGGSGQPPLEVPGNADRSGLSEGRGRAKIAARPDTGEGLTIPSASPRESGLSRANGSDTAGASQGGVGTPEEHGLAAVPATKATLTTEVEKLHGRGLKTTDLTEQHWMYPEGDFSKDLADTTDPNIAKYPQHGMTALAVGGAGVQGEPSEWLMQRTGLGRVRLSNGPANVHFETPPTPAQMQATERLGSQEGGLFWQLGGDDWGESLPSLRRAVGRMKPQELAGPNQGGAGTPEEHGLKAVKGNPQTLTPAFKRWFGDWQSDPARASKVVDGEGKPLVVYHGTNKGFTEFAPGPGDIGIHFGTAGQANDRLENKRMPSGGRVIPALLNIRNPLRLTDIGSWGSANVAYELQETGGFSKAEVEGALGGAKTEQAKLAALRSLVESKGNDGIVYENLAESEGANKLRLAAEKAWKLFKKKYPGEWTPALEKTPEYTAYKKAFEEEEAHRDEGAADSYIAFHPEQIKSALGNSGAYDPKNLSIIMGDTGVQTAGWLWNRVKAVAEAENREPSVHDLAPGEYSTTMETLSAYRKAGLLSNPATRLLHPTSQIVFNALEDLAKIPASLADMALSRLLGTERTVGMSGTGYATALRTAATLGVKQAGQIIKTGKIEGHDIFEEHPDVNTALEAAGVSREIRSNWFGSPVFDTATNYLFRSIEATDRIYKVFALVRSLEEQARLIAAQEAKTARAAGKPPVDEKARRAELLKGPTEAMMGQAVVDSLTTTERGLVGRGRADALEAAFQAPTSLGTAVRRGRASLSQPGAPPMSQLAAFGVDTVMPFANIPTNIVTRGLEYALGGVIAPIEIGAALAKRARANKAGVPTKAEAAAEAEQDAYRNLMLARSTGGGESQAKEAHAKAQKEARDAAQAVIDSAITPEQQARWAKLFGRGSVGVGVIVLGGLLAAGGVMTGFVGIGNEAELAEREKSGAPEASIRIPDGVPILGGKWLQLGRIGPLGQLLALGATLWERRAEYTEPNGFNVGNVGNAGMRAAAGIAHIADAELPLLTAGKSVTDALSGDPKPLARYGAQQAASYVPAPSGLLRGIAGAMDTKNRKVSGPLDAIKRGIPGLRQTLPENPEGVQPTGIAALLDPLHDVSGPKADPELYTAGILRDKIKGYLLDMARSPGGPDLTKKDIEAISREAGVMHYYEGEKLKTYKPGVEELRSRLRGLAEEARQGTQK